MLCLVSQTDGASVNQRPTFYIALFSRYFRCEFGCAQGAEVRDFLREFAGFCEA